MVSNLQNQRHFHSEEWLGLSILLVYVYNGFCLTVPTVQYVYYHVTRLYAAANIDTTYSTYCSYHICTQCTYNAHSVL